MDNQKIVDGLNEYITAALMNLYVYRQSGDQRAIMAGEQMVRELEQERDRYAALVKKGA